jgi:hypothetical protein
VITCRGVPLLGGSPITARLDDEALFLTWDHPTSIELRPGRHGIDISHEPIRWPFGANKLSRSLDCNAGFRYHLEYVPRALPMLPPKIRLTVDRS